MDIKNTLRKAEDLFKRKDFIESKKNFLKILKKIPNHISSLNNLGFIEFSLGDKAKAISYLNKSIIFFPNQPSILCNLAIMQSEAGDLEDALNNLSNAITLDPENALFFYNRARIFSQKNELNNAIEDYIKSIQIDNHYVDSYLNLGFLYNKVAYYDKAIEVLENLLEFNNNSKEAYYNLGVAFSNKKNFVKAEEFFLKCLSVDPDYDLARFNLACNYLSQENFKDGWKLYDSRWCRLQKHYISLGLPESRDILKDSNVLIYGEQGIGDQILFASIIQELKPENDYTFAIDKRLVPIFKRSFPKHSFIDINNIPNQASYQYQLSLGDLGKHLRQNKKDFKGQKDFLKPNQIRVDQFKEIFSLEKKVICGISWKSNNTEVGQDKSMNLSDLVPILNKRDIKFIDLQYGDTELEKHALKERFNIEVSKIDSLDKFYDLDGLISLIASCDFVLTTSNVTAHLAGSIGKKTFLFVPDNIGSIWYWSKGEKSLWYPSIDIFRKPNNQSWLSFVEKVNKFIYKHFAA